MSRHSIQHRPLARGPQTDQQINALLGQLGPGESLVVSFIASSRAEGEGLAIDRKRQTAVTSAADAREVLAQAVPGREQEIEFQAIKGWDQLAPRANG